MILRSIICGTIDHSTHRRPLWNKQGIEAVLALIARQTHRGRLLSLWKPRAAFLFIHTKGAAVVSTLAHRDKSGNVLKFWILTTLARISYPMAT